MPKKKKRAPAEKRRMPKTLEATLYCYVEPANKKHACTEGKARFGSFSGYVNALISKDRGVQPKLGTWKAREKEEKLPARVKKVKGKRPARKARARKRLKKAKRKSASRTSTRPTARGRVSPSRKRRAYRTKSRSIARSKTRRPKLRSARRLTSRSSKRPVGRPPLHRKKRMRSSTRRAA